MGKINRIQAILRQVDLENHSSRNWELIHEAPQCGCYYCAQVFPSSEVKDFEENENGFLFISKGDGLFTRRQDVPKTYEYNGAIYVINPASLKKMTLGQFTKRKKYLMDDIHSVDLDNMIDWKFAEFIIKENLL